MTPEELATLYRTYGALVLGRCRRILQEDMAAEDALQEVFLRLWRYEASFAAAESKLGWLYRVAARCSLDQLARRRSRKEVSFLDRPPQPEPYTASQPVEDRDVVLRFLSRFEPKLQEVAVLHYIDGLGQEEIARETGWSRQTVFKKLTQLRQHAVKLRPILLPGA
ncbi:MAG: sigma-70 family RNA polymerase sigma factor [Polyangia bacterium]